jgi:hypothetical protein
MNQQERAARGIRARELLNSAEVQAAFAEVEAEIIGEWRKTVWPWRQRMKWNELRGLERLRSRLASYAGQAPR